MSPDLIERATFALQDERTPRHQAKRQVFTVLAVVQPGDDLGNGLVALRRGNRTSFKTYMNLNVRETGLGQPENANTLA